MILKVDTTVKTCYKYRYETIS